jgi:hypothetical protein
MTWTVAITLVAGATDGAWHASMNGVGEMSESCVYGNDGLATCVYADASTTDTVAEPIS